VHPVHVGIERRVDPPGRGPHSGRLRRGLSRRRSDVHWRGTWKRRGREGRAFRRQRRQPGGQVLDERLDEIGVPRGEVYITNIVKCRPTKAVKGRPPSNRPPRGDEIEACAPWLDEQVRRVNPKLIVLLGVRATSAILDGKVLMRKVHGEVVHGERSVWKGRTIIPTYHPAGIRGNTYRMRHSGRTSRQSGTSIGASGLDLSLGSIWDSSRGSIGRAVAACAAVRRRSPVSKESPPVPVPARLPPR
jgi:uracil-DNA glycosylase family 4